MLKKEKNIINDIWHFICFQANIAAEAQKVN